MFKGGGLVSEELCNAYGRGRLILKAMEGLPIEQYPELTLSANFWLPVQSYYTIHGVGLATMIALGRGSPRSHRSFRADFSELVSKYFPAPFCGRCTGGPERKEFLFPGISTSVDKVSRQSQLANPVFVEEIENFVGKSLSTTRERFLEFRFEDKRKDKGKRRLIYDERNECCQKEHATSICDLIYRMRVRSNYDNPDMYLFAHSDLENATKHYKDLRYLTKMVFIGLDALIERRIGKTEMGQLRSQY